MRSLSKSVLLLVAGLCVGCGSLGEKLAKEPPPLRDMEEPLELFDEPDDEGVRVSLPSGGFSGIYVGESGESLDELVGEESEGLTVTKVIENSPGAFAGVEAGDLLLEARIDDGEPVELRWPSEWRKIELENAPGTHIDLVYDRAEDERETSLVLAQRHRNSEREEAERFREESKVGLVVRTATEVEARGAGLGPGGGAVIVGMSQASPWRAAGLRFGDLITAIDGEVVAHPRVVLEAITNAAEESELEIAYRRGEADLTTTARVSKRKGEINEFTFPLLFSHESRRGKSKTKFLLGLLGYEETDAAWEFTLLWLITFSGGDADELEEVEQ